MHSLDEGAKRAADMARVAGVRPIREIQADGEEPDGAKGPMRQGAGSTDKGDRHGGSPWGSGCLRMGQLGDAHWGAARVLAPLSALEFRPPHGPIPRLGSGDESGVLRSI